METENEKMIHFLYDPKTGLTLTWESGHVSRFTGSIGYLIAVFFLPIIMWDLYWGRARMQDTEKKLEVIWPS